MRHLRDGTVEVEVGGGGGVRKGGEGRMPGSFFTLFSFLFLFPLFLFFFFFFKAEVCAK